MMAIFFASLLIFSPISNATDPNETLAWAAEEYRAGLAERGDSNKARNHFVQAAEAYEQAWNNGQRTPAVARNMAQARLLAGDVGRAVRDYRRGIQIAPHNLELRRGLAFARDQVAYPVVGDLEKAARPAAVDSPLDRIEISLPRLGLGAILVWALGWLSLARAWMSRRGTALAIGITCLVAASILGGWLAWQDARQRERYSEPTAVIVASGADLRLGNNEEYPRRIEARLPAGVELRVLGERGGWLHVEVADGTAGWLPRERAVLVD